MTKRTITLFAVLLVLLSAFKADQRETITIFMVGDSTMANKSLKGGNPERGWGHRLPGFFDEGIVIDNHAQNGRSSKSFISEGRWDKVLAKIRKGDYVFIQFGHNDEKTDTLRHTLPGSTFDANLRRYVDETRQKGGIPVLFSPIVRRHFDENGQLIDTHGAYKESAGRVAEELKVTYIDMHQITHDYILAMGPEKSKELFMWVPQNTVAIHPKGKEDDTHLNVQGGRVVASLAIDQIEKKIPELAKHICRYDFVVAQDGSGDFFTIQDAINAVPDFRKESRTTILVRPGIYKEKLIVPECKINVSLLGQTGAILSGDDYASKKNLFGENMSTSGSSTCYIYAPDFYAENITFENSAGPVGQAVACFVSGDRAMFKNCRFLGFQDTLYTYGKQSRQYYEDCYIEGTVDFIFGWSTVLFNRCTIHSKANGYLTAPSTDQGHDYGYVFIDCHLTADEGVDKVYLSRPWRPYGQAVFVRCQMNKHIAPEGWHNWGKKENEKTAYYAEYKSNGEGANPKARAAFSHQLKDDKRFTPDKVLAGKDGWNPAANGNSLVKEKR